jgi:hypothetical protein
MSWDWLDHLLELHPMLPPTVIALSCCFIILFTGGQKAK